MRDASEVGLRDDAQDAALLSVQDRSSSPADAQTIGDDWSTGSVREVATLAWPIVVGMLSYTAMGVADTLFVGWLGKAELTAVGLATAAVWMVNALLTGSLQGVRIVASQRVGAQDAEGALASAWHGLALAVPAGVVIALLSLWSGPVFSLLGGSPEVQAMALQYFQIRALGAPLWYAFTALCCYFQGVGDTRTPMKMNLLANGANIALDVVLIFGVGPFGGFGVAGAAIATAIAQGMALVGAAAVFLRLHGARPVWRAGTSEALLRLGLPIGVQHTLEISGFAVFTAILASIGEDAVAAHMIAMNIVSVSFLPGHGVGEAAGVMVGQAVGAGRRALAERATRSALLLNMGIMGLMAVAFIAAPTPLITLFQRDPEVVRITTTLLIAAAIFQIFDAITMTYAGALSGAGDTRYTMIVSILGAWLIMVPLTWLLGVHMGLGALGGWIAFIVELMVIAAANGWRWRSGAWASASPPQDREVLPTLSREPGEG